MDRRAKCLRLGPAARAKAAERRREPAIQEAFHDEITTVGDAAVARRRLMAAVARGQIPPTAATALLRVIDSTARHIARFGPVKHVDGTEPSPADRMLTAEEMKTIFAGVDADMARGITPPATTRGRIERYLLRPARAI